MFSFISQLDDVLNAPYGFQVLDVVEKSPAAEAGLVCFFDYIVKANDVVENNKLKEIIEENINKKVILTVYNAKNRKTRDVEVMPRNDWGGDSLLGTHIRFDKHHCSDECMINVLSVAADSPGAQAELQQYYDYILGTPEEEFESPDYFTTLLTDNIGKQIPLYVYNTHTDQILLTPSYTWGGKGCVGVQIGSGYLHQIPEKYRETTGSNSYSNPYLHLLSSNIPQYSLLKKTKSLNKSGRATPQPNVEDKSNQPIQPIQPPIQQPIQNQQQQQQQREEISSEEPPKTIETEAAPQQEDIQPKEEEMKQQQEEIQQPEVKVEKENEEEKEENVKEINNIDQPQQEIEIQQQEPLQQQEEEEEQNTESQTETQQQSENNEFQPVDSNLVQNLHIEGENIEKEGKDDEHPPEPANEENEENELNISEGGWGDETPLDLDANVESSQ